LKYQERIVELRSLGIENLDDEEIAEFMLLEEEANMEECIARMLQYYTR